MADVADGTPADGSGTRSAAGAEAGAALSAWTELEDHLERVRGKILEEIRSYPPPIAACDQQFNHLLEQRDRISAEIRRLASVRGGTAEGGDAKVLVDFLGACPWIDDALRIRLTNALKRRGGDTG